MIDEKVPIHSMKDAFSVEGLNVAITGGNRGMGFGIAEAFAQSGANVAILCRSVEKGDEAVARLADTPGNHIAVQCEVSDLESVKRAADEVYERFGHLDVLINNAGQDVSIRLIDDENLAGFHQVLNVNLIGPANTMHAFGRKMVEAGVGGEVINISSAASLSTKEALNIPMPGYHAAKAGLNMLSQYMAAELGAAGGIRVNTIAPGVTLTELNKQLPPGVLDGMLGSSTLTHRGAEPIEVGAVCVFLASPAGSQIDGTLIRHDGGQLVLG